MTRGRSLSRNVVVRAVIASVALVAAAFPGAVVLGGYVPSIETIGRFGVYLTTDIPWVILVAAAAMVLVGIALALGGGVFTKLLALLLGVVLGGSLLAAVQLSAVATANGASFSLLEQLERPAAVRAPDRRVVFATVEGIPLSADLWLPPESAPEAPATGRAALVFVHGGAFIAGDLGTRPWLYQLLADAGHPVLDIQYRLAPPPRWNQAPADVLCALAWVGGHATELGVDPKRVVLMGDSSGGSLALVAGYAAGTGRIAPSCGGTPVVPSGIVAVEPAADLEGLWQDRSIDDGSPTYPEAYIGGPPSEYPDRYAAASPFDYIRSGLPPTLIVTGANDHLVGLPRVQSIVDALQAAGAPVRFIVVPFGDHGVDGAPNGFGAQLLRRLVPNFVDSPG